MNRGEIRWYTFRLPDKRHPVLVLTRSDVIERINEIIVVPATRTVRGIASEVILTPDDGMPLVCALNFDHISLAQRNRIGAVLCTHPTISRHLRHRYIRSRHVPATSFIAELLRRRERSETNDSSRALCPRWAIGWARCRGMQGVL